MTGKPRVTIVVVPREGFSTALTSLESVFASTPTPFRLIYVDGGSPRPVARELRRLSEERGFRVIRTQHYLSPNQARNIGLAEVDTEYVAFVDNNVILAPGWLEALVCCADETGAWAVVPLTLYDSVEEGKVHFAGGTLTFAEEKGRRVLYDVLYGSGETLAQARTWVKRAPSDYIEFHACLARTDPCRKVGGCDERLLSTREHMDFSLSLTKAGGRIWLEPESVVAVIQPHCQLWSDLPYFLLRWSEFWLEETERRLFEKWGAGIHENQLFMLHSTRREAYRPFLRAVKKVAGHRLTAAFADRGFFPLEKAINRLAVRFLWRNRPA